MTSLWQEVRQVPKYIGHHLAVDLVYVASYPGPFEKSDFLNGPRHEATLSNRDLWVIGYNCHDNILTPTSQHAVVDSNTTQIKVQNVYSTHYMLIVSFPGCFCLQFSIT